MNEVPITQRIECENCPLNDIPHLRPLEDSQRSLISTLKTGEMTAPAGATVLVEGSGNAYLFSILSGWGFRYKTLDDGRRQILNYVFPGDVIGLQGSLMDEMQHSIEALSPLVLCVFQKTDLPKLFSNLPQLAYDLTWLTAREEIMLDEHLLSVGQRSALERTAYLIAFLHQRARAARMLEGQKSIPVTQQHLADTLGLSIVHTNKTLRRLAILKALRWEKGGCTVLDETILLHISGWEGLPALKRPYI
ncbi:Crp/Fnr family transcriptional regulator [Phyllobacterium phragmitis]|uniref:Crp/Fnr family transcriptional regulator n=1 Tax=Phyllobacterium phragmitis TaxID=2670329 RepID=A0ABQ0H2P1_9HYPH